MNDPNDLLHLSFSCVGTRDHVQRFLEQTKRGAYLGVQITPRDPDDVGKTAPTVAPTDVIVSLYVHPEARRAKIAPVYTTPDPPLRELGGA